MKRLVTNRVLVIGAAVSLAYVVATQLFSMADIFDVLNGAFLGVAVLVTAVYAPAFWNSVLKIGDRAAILAIGVGLVWASYIGSRFISIIYRLMGRSDELINNEFVGFCVVMAVVGGILHVAAPGYPADANEKTRLGGSYRTYIILGVFLGVASIYIAKYFV